MHDQYSVFSGVLGLGKPHVFWCCSVQFILSVTSDSLWSHGLQHSRPPCPSPTPRACSNSCPWSWWWHPTISFSVVHFSCLQSFPASASFPTSQFFASGGQSIGESALASVLPIWCWSYLYWFYFKSYFICALKLYRVRSENEKRLGNGGKRARVMNSPFNNC